jgi:outer membrane protein TolC
MRSPTTFVPAGLLLAVGLATAQEPARLSLAEALERGGVHHPAMVQARWERRAREADALGSAAAFLPNLTVELGATRTDDPVAAFGTRLRQGRFGQADFAIDALNFPDPIGDVSTVLTVEQPVFQPEALLARRAASAAAQAGRHSETRTGQVAAFDVIRAYFGALVAADRVAVLEDSRGAAAGTLRQVERLRREGVVTVVDEQLGRSRVSELEAAVAQARAGEAAALDDLLQLLALDPGTTVELTDSLESPGDVTAPEGIRPDLAALQAGVRAGDAQVLRAHSQWLPSVAAFGNLRWHDDEVGIARGPRRWTAGVMIRWTPFRGLADVGGLRRAQAERAAARIRLEAAERRAAAEVRAATVELEAAGIAAKAAEDALALAAQAARAAAARYEEGAATISELLAVRATESSQRLALLQTRYQARLAAAALTLARGGTPR